MIHPPKQDGWLVQSEETRAVLTPAPTREDLRARMATPAANDNAPRKGDWIQTYTGRSFWPLDPRASEVNIADIAHSLSMQCRYAGHCIRFYSVAEHSVLLAKHVSADNRLWALLHDASEAYLIDVPRPIKHSLGGYKDIESAVMTTVAEAYGLRGAMPAEVHDADIRICVDEKAQNMSAGPMWGIDGLDPIGVQLQFWPPAEAEAAFLDTFAEIMRGI